MHVQLMAFFQALTEMSGYPPVKAGMTRRPQIILPSVHKMLLNLDCAGLIASISGKSLIIRILVDPDNHPALKRYASISHSHCAE